MRGERREERGGERREKPSGPGAAEGQAEAACTEMPARRNYGCEYCGWWHPRSPFPFPRCNLCGAAPSYHHGRCCPRRPRPAAEERGKKIIERRERRDEIGEAKNKSSVDYWIKGSCSPAGDGELYR